LNTNIISYSTGGPEFCSPQGLLDVQGFENDEEFQDIPDSLPLFSKTYRKTSFNNEYSDDNDNISDDSKIIFELENKYDMESISIIRDLRKKKSEKSSLKNDYEDNRIKIKTETDSSINKNKMDTDMYTTSMISNKKDFLTQTLRGNSSSSSPISSLPSRPHVEKLKPVMPSHNPFASKSQGKYGIDIIYIYLKTIFMYYVYMYILCRYICIALNLFIE
jgi:hypothetical protein